MTNEKCISYCRGAGFTLAGSEYGFQCFCGNLLYDSVLLDNSNCNMTCSGSNGVCGGAWALSVFSPDGRVTQAPGLESQFELPQLAPGMSEISVHPGGLLNTVVPVTTPLILFPRQVIAEPSHASSRVSSVPAYSTLSPRAQPAYGLPSPAGTQGTVSVVKAASSVARTDAETGIVEGDDERAGAQSITA
jgi:hypothetical protein